MVEQMTFNHWVQSSNLCASTKNQNHRKVVLIFVGTEMRTTEFVYEFVFANEVKRTQYECGADTKCRGNLCASTTIRKHPYGCFFITFSLDTGSPPGAGCRAVAKRKRTGRGDKNIQAQNNIRKYMLNKPLFQTFFETNTPEYPPRLVTASQSTPPRAGNFLILPLEGVPA